MKNLINYALAVNKKLLIFIFMLVTSIGTIFADRVKIGDLYYSLDATKRTAMVTYQDHWSPTNYAGLIAANIPDTVDYNEQKYCVTSIGESAFMSCSSLTSVTIPNSVISIAELNAFYTCPKLTSVIVGSGNPIYDSRNNCNAIIETASNALILGCQSTVIPNSVTSIGDFAFASCEGLTSLTIPNGVISIGIGAFNWCPNLTSVIIPNSVTCIGISAFDLCKGLTNIHNYAITPQAIDTTVFGGVSLESEGIQYAPVDKSTCKLYVPEKSIELYRAAEGWKDFVNILPIAEEDVGVTTTTTETTATISWPQVTGAASYELVIKDKDGNIICTLIFNAQGQLLSIAFHAPSRNETPQQTQTAGFAFTVTGLEEGTTYSYTLTAKNSAGNVIDTKTGTFTTNGLEAIDDINAATPATKIIRDGQIYILRGDKTYTLTGQEIK